MRAPLFAFTLTALVTLGPAYPAFAQDNSEQKLGTVHFATSCNETAQRRFDRAMRYQHSFWYSASSEIYQETLKADPECAIAYWGIALSLLSNPHIAVPAPNLPLGLAAIEKAQALGAKTQRERDYIDALAVMYRDYDKTSHQARVQAYLQKMADLAARYPDDDEAQIFYAITLNVAAPATDKTYANQLKGAAILEPIFERQPQHPGVAHYLIHLYDYPPVAARGLPAALRYAKVAPNAPHAQHMPSHIFTRVGYWKESIAANNASVDAAKASKETGDQLHGQDYMVYAYLQLGQDKEARDIVDAVEATQFGPDAFAAAYAHAASPARYAMEREDWKGAANLAIQSSKFPHVMAVTYFARAIGAARSGDTDSAKSDADKLAALRDNLREAKNDYWAGQVDVQEQAAQAWILYAEGKYEDALKAMSLAADAEDKTEKSPVTPGPLMPARELYGVMLLDRGMANEALAAFEATMSKEPNRYNAYVGAAKAAQAIGDSGKAKTAYERLISTTGATSERSTLGEAKAFVAKN
ncbi:tetratricopeptide repeat protein [Bradyrhizobium sp. SYSU BS000235]|uniref:tetratricopeptide repeat protein n=1 Tax=Bradyrhizobium sp. SYSU BS000235 TaxID=3411332 RepID=UPI003C760E54